VHAHKRDQRARRVIANCYTLKRRLDGLFTMLQVPQASIDFVLNLFLAMGLGAMIGVERQLRNHEAGLKTNALVAAGSALFVMMAKTFGEPDRIVAQILPGIGFLGAGMILRDGIHVRGLNTAATLWCSAAVGTLAGAGSRSSAAIAAFTVMLANVSLRAVANWVDRKHTGSEKPDQEKSGQ
jgi:putative Mg2+ transporter-C (MgtC) family protein